ncbi:MAG: malectin domain-containing carbohydrate-binding protein, partial [Woeseiaceae bacterium]
DRPYVEGSWGHIGGAAERSHHRIFDTDDDPLYQTRRTGAHAYRFDVPDGSYFLELHFATLDDMSRDTDAFRVEINGLARSVSGLAPHTGQEIGLPILVSGGEGLNVRFVSEPATAFVNGILLQRVD